MTTTSSKDLRLTGIIEEIYSGDYQYLNFSVTMFGKILMLKVCLASVLLGIQLAHY